MCPRWHPARCKECGTVSTERLGISATGLCLKCGLVREAENLNQLVHHRGPYFERWRERIAASVGAALLDGRADEA